MSVRSVIIRQRFCGPPHSGNGGYVSGLLASAMDTGCQVTLHAPPPLDTELQLLRTEAGAELRQGDRLLGSAVPYQFELKVPPAPAVAVAEAAQQRFEGLVFHGLPGCFVCGTQREPGDGLRIFAGPVADGQVAALWRPAADLADSSGRVADEYLWAALDCPGFFAVKSRSDAALLGRFAARLIRPVQAEENLVVLGWALGHEGRKHHAGTALYRADGELVACAEATWISLKK